MRRSGKVPRIVLSALASPGGTCYGHCDRPIRARRIGSPLPGVWTVRACPTGVVSVTAYVDRSGRDLTPAVRTALRRWTVPPALVRTRDLRTATRHGPELGRAAERALARHAPSRPVRVVYWRVYPFEGPDGSDRRLFACFRRAHASPVFFAGDPARPAGGGCPVCARLRNGLARRGT
jgi:hypothetical protein